MAEMVSESPRNECQGHLRQEARIHLERAEEFWEAYNCVQTLSFCELAITKLKQLNDCPLDVTELFDDALRLKCNALGFMGQHKEALECARERYSLWETISMRNRGTSSSMGDDVDDGGDDDDDGDDDLITLRGMLYAAFPLIESLIHNHEYIEAEPIARVAYEAVIANSSIILPEDQRQQFLAQGSKLLALATYWLAYSNGIPSEEKQQAGEEAIALARNALAINTQLYGTENDEIAFDMLTLADILKYFNGEDDNEILRLYEQAIAIYSRVQGKLSPNVAVGENNLGNAYVKRADAAQNANDLPRCLTNLELALTHFHEAVRIYRAISQVDSADRAEQRAVTVENKVQQIQLQNAANVV